MEPNDEEQICMRIVDIIHNRPFCDEQWIKAASKGGTQGELRPPPLDDVYKNPDYTHQFETKSKIIMPLSLESGHLSKSKKRRLVCVYEMQHG